ncbi:WcaA Glycosyltransferases involved in cell wall biogenesis [Candidatus Nanopelagicaceae bacterium]
MKPIGIVVPCYNEELRIDVKYWQEIIGENENVYWVFVDDGSKDRTRIVLREMLNYENVKLLALEKNQGKSEAVRFGMRELLRRNESIFAIGFLDSDSAFTASDVERMIDLCDEKFKDKNSQINILISSRVKLAGRSITRDLKRHYISRVLLTVINWKWSGAPYDTQSGFKIFKNSSTLEVATELPFQTKWFVDLELFARSGAMNGPNQIWEEPVHSWKEVPGSKIGLKSSVKILKEIVLIMKILSRARSNY